VFMYVCAACVEAVFWLCVYVLVLQGFRPDLNYSARCKFGATLEVHNNTQTHTDMRQKEQP
jgi:hypothetical protein